MFSPQQKDRMSQEGVLVDGNFVCPGVTVAGYPNKIQPGSPAYRVVFDCTYTGITRPIIFSDFAFYYAQVGGLQWTVDIEALDNDSQNGTLFAKLSVSSEGVSVLMRRFNQFHIRAGISTSIMNLNIYYQLENQTYDFTLNADLFPRNDMGTLASSPLTVNTSPNNQQLLSQPSQLLNKSVNQDDTYPRIDILAFSTANDEDFGQVTYTVLDTVKHRGTYNCRNKEVSPGVYQSIFSRFPQINSILKGKGCSLKQKFTSIIDIYSLTISLNDFTANMALYMYLNNILTRLMYNTFDLKYLTPCFFDQFLADLQRKYPQYVRFFTTPRLEPPQYDIVGYSKYFECGCDCEK